MQFKAEAIALVSILIVTGTVALWIHPISRDLTNPISPELQYPLKKNSVPLSLLVVLANGLPLIVFGSVWMVGKISDADEDFKRAVIGLAQSTVLGAFVTQIAKTLAGRPRPNFVQMCLESAKQGTTFSKTSDCAVAEAIKSYPSGHSSYAFSGLFFLTLYALGKFKLNANRHQQQRMYNIPKTLRLFIGILPTLIAGWIAISRTLDYWHGFSDINAGALIGSISAYLAYRSHYPSIFSSRNPDLPLAQTKSKQDQIAFSPINIV
jgi:membrane-associated phospholipid phosphatase